MCNCCRGIHKTCGIKLVVTNAEYSPGTYHNMPSKLQATIQLFDHTWRAGMWFLHFTFSGADTKNVVASISVAGTPEELGRWWLKMPGNQQKALRTSQQHWSREPRASGGPTWGDASNNGAVESTNGMTEGQNGSEGGISSCVPSPRRTAASAVFAICIDAVE